MMLVMLVIDGSFGEGGGQILRTSLSLSAITRRPLHLVRIRARRSRPGLLAQHLTALNAIREVCAADVEGATLGSSEVRFTPHGVHAGRYRFAVGTAGSACLVLQTVLWPLLFADGPSELTLEGGTHNEKAPTFDFLASTFLPLLGRMGARVDAKLERHGFYPAGSGRMRFTIHPGAALERLDLEEAGPVLRQRARILIARLPAHIAEREQAEVHRGLRLRECAIETVDSIGPGNVVMLQLEREQLTETITGFGRRGVPAERVAADVVRQAREYLRADVPVGEHLADQLIVPMALAGGGAFRTVPLSLHSTTNIDVVRRFVDIDIATDTDASGRVRVFA
jgi:RNA 3'-terminal phosphate cyclase (ATP)